MSAPIAVPGLERKEEPNPFNYTEDQKTEKKLALKTMKELWPDVNPMWAEWVYDMCKNTPDDKIKEIMHKVETEPTKHFTVNDPRSHLYEEAKQQNVESVDSWKQRKKNIMHNSKTQ
jgi:hypothetical protein